MAKNTPPTNTKHNKKSSVRHTRAIQRDRSKRPVVAPPDKEIEERLNALVVPAMATQQAAVRQLGLRGRLLPLSVMVALVISLIWRQLGAGGSEAARLLATEGLLWSGIITVSQQAISLRLRVFPATLFLGVLQALLPTLAGTAATAAASAGLGADALHSGLGGGRLNAGCLAAQGGSAARCRYPPVGRPDVGAVGCGPPPAAPGLV
jgi:hypothetical protein